MDKKEILLNKIKEIRNEKKKNQIKNQNSIKNTKPLIIKELNANIKLKKNNILLYEKDEKEMSRLKLFLIKNNYNVFPSLNRTHFFDFLKNNKIDLIILTYLINDNQVKELIKKIKINPKFQKIPIIILTNSSNKDDVYFFFNYKVHSYLLKPIQFPKLLQKVKELFDKQKKTIPEN